MGDEEAHVTVHCPCCGKRGIGYRVSCQVGALPRGAWHRFGLELVYQWCTCRLTPREWLGVEQSAIRAELVAIEEAQ